MQAPKLSTHFADRKPSAIRTAQIEFMKRDDDVDAINTAIGNVSLPMHPAMRSRMAALGASDSPFAEGVVKYSATVGIDETCAAATNIIASSGLSTDGLFTQITDGGSAAMELLIVGVCGPAGSEEKPLLLIDAAYTNYMALAERTGRKTVSVQRTLGADGKFSLPDIAKIEDTIKKYDPGALVVIPYDNPTGHYYEHDAMVELARLCVKYNLWMASDEAYRELYYSRGTASSIWRISEEEVPGITGRRISIETASKVWNACGLRIGALVTDNESFHTKSVAEYTANLCTNVIGQYIFGALAHESHDDLKKWYDRQRAYYKELLSNVYNGLKEAVPGLIVSSPDASIYSVVEVRDVVKPGFNAQDFVLYCSRKGRVEIDGKSYTLLVSPMAGFYQVAEGEANPGLTQMRIAYVDTPDRMALVPRLFASLLKSYEQNR
ncbi:MAG: aminotransferase class I/II-fold pyridoxal phosphate-dependent enzyme [Deltaproteobacteria bacterium]|nr:aminotransferase class I/II-fold pyridoxal phosphate-dependent enzyme [Deltaproteobacteria bacterium]